MTSPITQVLHEARLGAPGAREELFRLCYDELRRIAAGLMRGQPADHVLQPTALVNEACLRLLARDLGAFPHRGAFYAFVARAMRSVLVDLARARAADKRGGAVRRVALPAEGPPSLDATEEVLAVHEALEALRAHDPFLAQVVELRFFGGLTVVETAAVLGVAERTVYGAWQVARLRLAEQLA